MLALLLLLAPGDAVLVKDGVAACAVVVPRRVLDAPASKDAPAWNSLDPAVNALRLRDSARDLANVLGRMSGARVEVVADALPAGDKRLPILVGELATKAHGAPAKKFPYGQGMRLVVTEKGIGLSGESDLGASYAVYELLDQLGCRWYMPGPSGEVLRSSKTIAARKQDLSTGPRTVYRGMWYIEQDFARRNRFGGMVLQAGHALEETVPKELRKTNPEIRAVVGGKPDERKVKWTHPLVAKAIADAILDQKKKNPKLVSFSLSPDDGVGWDESDDAKFDAGDWDAAAGAVSKTDRLMVMCNRVAEAVSKKHPEVKLGVLAYADYIRPPLKQKVHPSVVPQIAPITFSRAQPMTDDGEPNNKSFRFLVEGWGKASEATSCYFYAYNLAEVSAPNPMIAKWGINIPFMYDKGKCKYWQPETLPNFETCLHAHWLGNRLAWAEADPKALIDELHTRFYGAAAREMAAYWTFIDDTWVKTPEYAGCGFGHLRRWNEKAMKQARALMDAAKKAAKTDTEKKRIALADDSLISFEQFMAMRRDLAGGRFAGLPAQCDAYVKRMEALSRTHQPEYAFSYVAWGFGGKGGSLNSIYFNAFYEATHRDAGRLAKDFTILTPTLREWKWKQDEKKALKPDADASAWKTTDVAVDTWSALGMHNFMGSVWYRRTVKLPAVPKGKKAFLWLGATDGSAKVFVNGKHAPWSGPKGEKEFSGYCQPASFDITAHLKEGDNEVAVLCTRTFLNELGTGGLLAAPVVYREK
ncbi:MAG: DUF4838 domain-containing protein [Gemmataceae bacterium]|nr:DUF4838 domain-containing protein [Gemmataceae bacterium]